MFRVLKQRELTEKIDSLNKEQKEKNKLITALIDAIIKFESTIETLQNACNHEVIIETSTEPIFGKEQSHILTICVICGKCIERKE
jgi:hypothetical protein